MTTRNEYQQSDRSDKPRLWHRFAGGLLRTTLFDSQTPAPDVQVIVTGSLADELSPEGLDLQKAYFAPEPGEEEGAVYRIDSE